MLSAEVRCLNLYKKNYGILNKNLMLKYFLLISPQITKYFYFNNYPPPPPQSKKGGEKGK